MFPFRKDRIIFLITVSLFVLMNNLNVSAIELNSIVPKPVSSKLLKGKPVKLDSKSVLLFDSQISDQALFFNSKFKDQLGFELIVGKKRGKKSAVNLLIDTVAVTHPEGYKLKVENNNVNIIASTPRGIIYGIQTFLQLLPVTAQTSVSIDPLEIEDYPRFAYRGMHLDVSRHMFPVDFIKKYIDYLSFHKLNTLHWHLTDDQGWRFEVLSYPKLNTVGSWRDETLVGHFKDTPIKYDSTRYGGYYTRDEIKDIIGFASVRGIDIIPEIDIPGHSRAIIAAYPEFSTRPDTIWPVATTWGMFNRQNNVLAPKPETFQFLKTIFEELADLFPSEYIHLGGDECSKKWWKDSPETQQFIADNDLKDEVNLQTYFIRQVAEYIQEKGKKVIGWDEIIDGDLDESTIVMSWRGQKGGINAARRNHNVIMTSNRPMYFNCSQSHEPRERCAMQAGYYPLDMVYNYDPVPEELKDEGLASKILGGQACLWTEYIPDEKAVEYMIFPRMTALSEVLWVDGQQKDFDDFKRRLEDYVIPRYKLWNADYFSGYDKWDSSVADKK